MGSSRSSSARLLGFLSDAVTRGPAAALKELNLESLIGRPVDEIFLGLADVICPEGGSIDEGIARDAFIETITELAQEGISDLDDLDVDQMHVVMELYATNAIEGRICNDIASKIITLPQSIHQSEYIQRQLHDFVRRGVSDAIRRAMPDVPRISSSEVTAIINDMYTQAFEILQDLGDAEANS